MGSCSIYSTADEVYIHFLRVLSAAMEKSSSTAKRFAPVSVIPGNRRGWIRPDVAPDTVVVPIRLGFKIHPTQRAVHAGLA